VTAALSAVGVQYVSITIAAGSTSNTATITAVGTGGFIILMGQSCSGSQTSETKGLARVELTNTTTVTANRNTSDASLTLTVKACVVDGDTTNLIKSVQSGTIALSTVQTSNTASISAVTNNNTATVILGFTMGGDLTDQLQAMQCRLSLATTTVTATRNSAQSTAMTVGFQCIEFQGAALNSAVQNISKTWTTGTSATSTITSVTAANSWLANAGNTSNTSTSVNAFIPNKKITNATTVTFATNADPGGGTNISNCTVVEFVAGVLTANAVQRGTVSLSAASSGTLTITSVTQAQAMTNWLNNTTSTTNVNNETSFYQSAFTNATTITVSDTASVTGIGSIEVIEFNPVAAGGTFNPGWAYGATRIIGGVF